MHELDEEGDGAGDESERQRKIQKLRGILKSKMEAGSIGKNHKLN